MTDPAPDEPEWIPARQAVLDALRPMLPVTWQLVDDERPRPDVGAVRVLVSQRTVDPHPAAGTRMHAVGFTVTITVPGIDLEAAEHALDDELEAFLWAVDEAGYLWTTATKAIYDDRLGYQLGMSVNSRRKEP